MPGVYLATTLCWARSGWQPQACTGISALLSAELLRWHGPASWESAHRFSLASPFILLFNQTAGCCG